jgi:sortase A
MSERAPSNGLANAVVLLGFALLIVGGISAYPSLRGPLGLESVPQGFGDEAALSASIVQADESLPPAAPGASTAPATSVDPAPAVLPETPLQSDPLPTPEPALAPAAPAPTSAPEAVEAPQDKGFAPAAPSRLVIPAINLDAPVESVSWRVTTQNGQQVSMWDVPNRFAAGWLKTTAHVGEPGNMVLDGHHNIAGEVFRDLIDLKQGDTIRVWAGDRAREYVVSLLKILPEKGQPIAARLANARWIQPTEDERLTLVTCWPYTGNTHRLIVVALPADRALELDRDEE